MERLIAAICDLGISEGAATALISRYQPAYLWRMVRQTRYARRVRLANYPAGWFLASVREDWPAPRGFREWLEMDREDQREALYARWGICRRCWSRPCHCEITLEEREGRPENDGEIETQKVDESAGEVAQQDDLLSREPR